MSTQGEMERRLQNVADQIRSWASILAERAAKLERLANRVEEGTGTGEVHPETHLTDALEAALFRPSPDWVARAFQDAVLARADYLTIERAREAEEA